MIQPKTARITCLAITLLSLSIAGCKKTEWKEFRSPDGRFSIMVPDAMKESSEVLHTAAGPITMHMYQEDELFMSMMCAYSDFPVQEGSVVDPEKIFDGSRNEIARQQLATVTSEEKITVDGYPGRLIKMTKSGGLNLKLKLIWANPRYYEVLVVAQDLRAGSEDIDRFLDSFKIQL